MVLKSKILLRQALIINNGYYSNNYFSANTRIDRIFASVIVCSTPGNTCRKLFGLGLIRAWHLMLFFILQHLCAIIFYYRSIALTSYESKDFFGSIVSRKLQGESMLAWGDIIGNYSNRASWHFSLKIAIELNSQKSIK